MDPVTALKLGQIYHQERLQEAAHIRRLKEAGLTGPGLSQQLLSGLARLLLAAGRKLHARPQPVSPGVLPHKS